LAGSRQSASVLLSDRLGQFDLENPHPEFLITSASSSRARLFIDLFSEQFCFSEATVSNESGSVSSLFRDGDKDLPIIQLMNPELNHLPVSEEAVLPRSPLLPFSDSRFVSSVICVV
jgi:hypothetical protein